MNPFLSWSDSYSDSENNTKLTLPKIPECDKIRLVVCTDAEVSFNLNRTEEIQVSTIKREFFTILTTFSDEL